MPILTVSPDTDGGDVGGQTGTGKVVTGGHSVGGAHVHSGQVVAMVVTLGHSVGMGVEGQGGEVGHGVLGATGWS